MEGNIEASGFSAEAGMLADVANHITIRQVTAMDKKVILLKSFCWRSLIVFLSPLKSAL
jgi:hypothetical protein